MNNAKRVTVKGYLITRYDEKKNVLMETLYAVADDGSVKVSQEHKQSPSFAGKWTWSDCAELPKGVTFCGNYEPV